MLPQTSGEKARAHPLSVNAVSRDEARSRSFGEPRKSDAGSHQSQLASEGRKEPSSWLLMLY